MAPRLGHSLCLKAAFLTHLPNDAEIENPMMPNKRNKLLSHTRPLTVASASSTAASFRTLSSRSTRRIIHSHHRLQKQLAQAQATNDTPLISSLQSQLEANGGLAAYQRASIQGQANDRGGDTSRVLVKWFREVQKQKGQDVNAQEEVNRSIAALNLLEVGCLTPNNSCARCGLFNLTRIDLQSQHPEILQQDFLQRPLPRNDTELFDVISLSLVLNYVPVPEDRGLMLERAATFLRLRTKAGQANGAGKSMLPGVFLVLPAPCVLNSRYLDEERLVAIMGSFGFELRMKKYSSKLAYTYWRLLEHHATHETFVKKEVAKGAGKNNFAIVSN